jgi:hypothetical protein
MFAHLSVSALVKRPLFLGGIEETREEKTKNQLKMFKHVLTSSKAISFRV